MVSFARPDRRHITRFFAATGGLAALLAAIHVVQVGAPSAGGEVAAVAGGPPPPSAPFLPDGWVSPDARFFPSPATTRSGGTSDATFLVPELSPDLRDAVRSEVEASGFAAGVPVGSETCVRCHADVTAQWETSAHRFASFNNPFYAASVIGLREQGDASDPWMEAHLARFSNQTGAGQVRSKWCAGCHDPALLFSGAMGAEVDATSVEAQTGLTCLACHAVDRIHGRTGNAGYRIADDREDPYLLSDAPPGSPGEYLHDLVLKARPEAHKAQMQPDFMTQPELCGSCHKVSLTEPVNGYRWLRGQNEFDNWDDSGVSLNASRTFYLPPTRRVCQDCHMPLEPAPLGDLAAEDGAVRSHRFLAVNTALPFIRGDDETLDRAEAFLREGRLRVDVFAATRSGETVMEIDRRRPTLTAGSRVVFDVVVRNQGVGHTFPGGTNDSNEGWLEVTLSGPDGVLAISGALDEEGHLGPAHVFKALMLDASGEPVLRRNAQDLRATVFANVIGPGTADLAHYEVVIPQELAGTALTVRARLLWRKFNRDFTEFAFRSNPGAFARFAGVPTLPVTEIAADSVTLTVGGAAAVDAEAESDGPIDPDVWIRYNDYGIGSLLEGNTRAAALAFAEVERLRPDLIDGPLNQARAAIADGAVEAAYDALRRVEAVEAGDPRAAWVWAQVLQEDGRYPEALLAYERVLEAFPGDRAAWRAMGRTLYLDQQYEEALGAFARVLAIDPEDRVSHYHRMLSLRALGREDEARLAEAAHLYYSVDESAQEITRDYRLRDAHANLMAQAIRTHRLEIVR
jgi:tetratricopeptide (TPR) repeat protein